MQGSAWPLGFLMKYCTMLRNRMLVDPSFLFKVGTEVVIDSCCATFAEVRKRGKDFWSEFELYSADLLVGIVVDIALVGMLAPYARIGKLPVSGGFLGRMQHVVGAIPSSSEAWIKIFFTTENSYIFLQGSLVWLCWIWLWSYWPRHRKYDYECEAAPADLVAL